MKDAVKEEGKGKEKERKAKVAADKIAELENKIVAQENTLLLDKEVELYKLRNKIRKLIEARAEDTKVIKAALELLEVYEQEGGFRLECRNPS